jgi:hypothetical protein
LAVVQVTGHHLKFHRSGTEVKSRGVSEVETGGIRDWEDLKCDRGIPWWRALNASLDQA